MAAEYIHFRSSTFNRVTVEFISTTFKCGVPCDPDEYNINENAGIEVPTREFIDIVRPFIDEHNIGTYKEMTDDGVAFLMSDPTNTNEFKGVRLMSRHFIICYGVGRGDVPN